MMEYPFLNTLRNNAITMMKGMGLVLHSDKIKALLR